MSGTSTGNVALATTGNVGIGTVSPGYKLDVAGTGSFYSIRISSGAVNNYVLTSDASGNARWASVAAAAATAWDLIGNAGTTAGTNFLGTTDNIDVVFKRNNIEGMRLSGASGNLVTTADAVINGVTVGRGRGNMYGNVVNGSNSLSYNTTGWENTAIGEDALLFNTTGFQNTAIGSSSLYSNLTGYYNTANGSYVL